VPPPKKPRFPANVLLVMVVDAPEALPIAPPEVEAALPLLLKVLAMTVSVCVL
jgi:hypothetical protein